MPATEPFAGPVRLMKVCVMYLPVGREHLQAAILPVGHVDQIVVRHLHGVHGSAELLRARAVDIERAAPPGGGGLRIDRRVAEGAPHALERAGVGVEHDHAAVAVAVGDEQPRWSSGGRTRRPAC